MKDIKFWGKVKKCPSKTGCWLWEGAKDKYGYGRVVRLKRGNTPMKVHRYAFFLHYGRWPEGMCAHSCGNKACVRREHLYDDVRKTQKVMPLAATYLEGYAQQIRGRYVKGSRINGVAGLAKQYGLDTPMVYQMVKGTFG